jgi:hypothetical protein
MNIQKDINRAGSIDHFLNEGNCETLGSIKNESNSINTTFFEHFAHKEHLALDNKTNEYKILNNTDEIQNFIKEQFEVLFIKQPILAQLCSEIFISQVKRTSLSISLDGGLRQFESLKNKLLNRDTMRNVKNSKYSFTDALSELKKYNTDPTSISDLSIKGGKYTIPLTFEGLDDTIHNLVTTQKAKKMIQKIYSNNYRELVNDDTLNKFKILVEKDISISDVNHNFGKKLARHKNQEDANAALNTYINSLSGWSIETYKQKAIEHGATIANETESKLCLKIHTYEQSEQLGSGQWCLSYDKEYLIDYKRTNNSVFFTYDFSKDQNDQTSMCGLIVNTHDEVTNAHWRDDMSVPQYYEEEDEDEPDVKALLEFYDLLPQTTGEDEVTNIWDSGMLKDSDYETTLFFLENCQPIEFIEILERANKEKLLDYNIDSKISSMLTDYYDVSIIDDNTDPSTLLLKKRFKTFVKNYINDATYISNTIPTLPESFLKNKDFDMLELYITKIQPGADVTKILGSFHNDLDDENTRNKNLNLFKKHKSKNDKNTIFDHKVLAGNLFVIDLVNSSDLNDFYKNIIELNNGIIDIKSTLDLIIENGDDNDHANRALSNNKILNAILENVSPAHLKDEWQDIKKKYTKDTIDPKILKKIDQKINIMSSKKILKNKP